MLIDRNIAPFISYDGEAIEYALKKISANARRIVFCVSEEGLLRGIITDGDFRRWVVSQNSIDLHAPASEVANTDFVAVPETAPHADIERQFSARVTAVPLVDELGRLTAIAWPDRVGLSIGGRQINDDQPVFIIAEIGNNHNGDIGIARKLVDAAVAAGADCAKFQMRNMKALYQDDAHSGSEDLGAEYTLDLLTRFQLTDDEMLEMFAYCRESGIIPMCTPWDMPSLKLLDENGIEGFKIASADLTNQMLLKAVAGTGKPMILSTGMSAEYEIIEAVRLLKDASAPFALLNCNSTYPTPFQDVNLKYMSRLKEIGECVVGYSGHERGYEVPIAAAALGAKVIEKHITLDREMEGNDHRVSLLPDEFAAMVRAVRNVELAMGTAKTRRLSQGERLNRENLAKSIIAKQDIPEGTVITREMLDIRSPGRGLQPNRMDELVGVRVTHAFRKGDTFFESDMGGVSAAPRAYSFKRPWGVPVRYHDFATMTGMAPVDFVEIHFSYRDLDLEPKDYFDKPVDIGLAIHSPELFAGDHIMDLSTSDEAYRKRSVMELQRVIDRTRELKAWFPKTPRPVIVINAGGFTRDGFLAEAERAVLYERIAKSLSEVDADGVEIIPQTMPPFPWHFGGQRYHNLFMDPKEISAFCKQHGMRICFDVSHSKLACNYFNWSLQDFIAEVGPYTAHMHIVDAHGNDDEGLQIGEGDMDFTAIGRDLDRHMPGATFIPEIWQGHKNNGEGFWIALDRLETLFDGSSVEMPKPKIQAVR